MAKRKHTLGLINTDLFKGLGNGESSEVKIKDYTDLLGDEADFALSTHPSVIHSHKSGLPMYVVEAMIKVGKHSVNIGNGDVKVW